MQVQYNFKIEEELKNQAEELSSSFANKEELLKEMVIALKEKQSKNVHSEIDLSKYDEIDAQTKEVLEKTFKHLVYTIQMNSSSNKQLEEQLQKDIEEAHLVKENSILDLENVKKENADKIIEIAEIHKKDITKERTNLRILLEENDEIRTRLDITNAELENVKKENADLKIFSKQIENISSENDKLRTDIKNMELKHKEEVNKLSSLIQAKEITKNDLEKSNYKLEIELGNVKKEVEENKELEKLIKKLEKENTILSTKLELANKKPTK